MNDLTHKELEQRIKEYKEEIPKCNPLQRDALRAAIRDAYKRLIKEGRYSNHLLWEIVRGRDSCYSADYCADVLSHCNQCVWNVESASWADTQGEYKAAQKDLVELVKDLYSLVDKEDVKDESHLAIIAKLVG